MGGLAMTNGTDPTLSVRQDLRAIVTLSGDLEEQAVSRAAHRDLPGGDAMVMLGPVASPRDRERRGELVEADWLRRHGGDWCEEHATVVDQCDHRLNPWADEGDWEPVLQTLRFWSEAWRDEWDKPNDAPTVASEAEFLNRVALWAYDHEPRWEDFERDVRAARARIEAVLYAGERDDRSQVPCPYCTEDRDGRPIQVRLVRYVEDRKGRGDEWDCPKCRRRFDYAQFIQAEKQHLESEGADRFVPLAIAVAVIPRPESTVRSWLVRTKFELDPVTRQERLVTHGKATWACDLRTRQVVVWWPHIRTMNEERTARRAAAS